VYILRFTPRVAGGPSAVVTLGACPHAYGITVNGQQQPSLWDDGKLRMAAAALAEVRDDVLRRGPRAGTIAADGDH